MRLFLSAGEVSSDMHGAALAIALRAARPDVELVGRLFGGTQVVTPRVQVVASPTIRNLAVPNEDSRAIDLQDSNLSSTPKP